MKIKIDESAGKELNEAIEWYELHSTGLGKKYKEVVKKQIELIKQNPGWFLIETVLEK